MDMRMGAPFIRGFCAGFSPDFSSIIAVHGLNPKGRKDSEHAWDTWRTPPGPSGRLWLRDDLPKQLPDSRVFLYQYNSTAWYGKDKSNFVDKANALLEAIRLKRRSDEKRPLLLLGHSLGGLLIKQALINACNNEKYQQIKLATKGLVFFATPHRGGNGSWVSLGYLAAKITSRGDTILQALDKGSMFTDLLHEHCRHRLLDFDIVSFWGTLDHIVSKESASLGLPGNRENVVSLDADHSSICKFGVSVTDKDNLETVLGNIQDLAENALKIDELSSLGGLAIFQGCTLRVPHQLDSPSARDSGLMDRIYINSTCLG
ncbi:hypothetical protein F5X97DRAFT_325365 [Nemania serpens]|nr:hypothetical protein F5X97DRAFT_325365 [Nemania serpens]